MSFAVWNVSPSARNSMLIDSFREDGDDENLVVDLTGDRVHT